MALAYNAHEIYQIGIGIEENGKKFYDTACLLSDDEDAQKLFSELAAWENTHITLFTELQNALAEHDGKTELFDPDQETLKYLKAAADSHVFVQSIDVEKLVRDCDNPIDILKLALRFEKDSVVVYSTMKDIVPETMGKSRIDRLIREEIMHVSFITDKVKTLSGDEL
ncbi:MAG: rubrerythrin [Chitinivibrionales bacterium]|nr:rubrerythrin [Chitinivibrionales bacterium]